MFSKLHERLGPVGLAVAVVALVAALAGTAFAAASLNGTQKKEVKKIAKRYAGKPGAPGVQGPAGPQGAAGSNGKNGTDGQNGTPGAPGKPGANVIAEEVAGEPGEECEEVGGYSFEVEGSSSGPNYICNGANGENGSFGGEPVPSGQTVTGTYAVSTQGVPHPRVAISYPIKFAGAPTGTEYVHLFETTSHCPGEVEGPLAAEPGWLCIYEGFGTENIKGEPQPASTPDLGRDGQIIEFEAENPEGVTVATGGWARTAQ